MNDLKPLDQIQREVGEWSRKTFGANDQNYSKSTGLPMGSQAALTGIVEEVGELNHVTICRHQGRRGYDVPGKYSADRDDAVGDLMIFLLDYCERENISLLEALNRTWGIVGQRNLKNWEQITHDKPLPVESSGQ